MGGGLVSCVTRYVGKISYSAYLTHFGVLYWLDKVMPQPIIPVSSISTNILNFHLKFSLVVLLTVLISTVTYQFIEKPAQQFGKRFLSKPAEQTLVEPVQQPVNS